MNKGKRAMLFMYAIIFWASHYAVSPYLVEYLDTLGTSEVLAGVIIGSYGFFQVGLRIPLGIWSDRINKQRIFCIFGAGAMVVSLALLCFVQTPIAVLISRTLAGFSAAIWICYIVVFQNDYKGIDKVKGASRMFGGSSLGRIVGVLTGTLMMMIASYFQLYIVALVFSVVTFFATFLIEDVPTEGVNKPLESIKEALQDKRLLSGSLLVVFIQIAMSATIYAYASKIISVNFSVDHIGSVSLVSIFGMFLVPTFVNDKLTKKLGIKKSIYITSLLSMVYITFFPLVENIVVLYVLGFIGGCGIGGVYAMIMGYAVSTVSDKIKGLAMGTFQSAVGIGVVVGPVLFGVLYSAFGLVVAFLSMNVMMLLAMLVTKILVENEK